MVSEVHVDVELLEYPKYPPAFFAGHPGGIVANFWMGNNDEMWQLSGRGKASAEGKKEKGEKKRGTRKRAKQPHNHQCDTTNFCTHE